MLLPVFLLIGCFAGFAQSASETLQITGTVKTDSASLAGVSVVLATNKKIAAITDNAGNFKLAVPANGKGVSLIISSIGFESKQVTLKPGESIITIVLNPADANQLNDVVVTALGVRKEKKALAYAVTEIKGNELTQAREVNVANALEGKIAGVNATSLATGPGGSSRVIIRGNGSLNGDNQPLYVVNGMPIDNSTFSQPSTTNAGGLNIDRGDGIAGINPDDIETITVLKGGTAAALYGARAANGVILITTKKGAVRKGIGIDYNSTITFETPELYPDWQYEYGEGKYGTKVTTQADATSFGRLSYGAKMDGTNVIQFDGVERPYSPQKDNIKNFYETGTTFTNTLAFSGGNNLFMYRVSLSNLDNHSIVPNSSLNKKIGNISITANPFKKLTIEANAQYNYEKAANRTGVGDAPGNANWGVFMIANTVDVRNLAPGYDANGNEILWNSSGYATNPYFAINRFQTNDIKNRFIGYASLKYNLFDNLFIRGRVSQDHYDYSYTGVIPTGTAYLPLGEYHKVQSIVSETNAELTVNYNASLKDFHFNIMAGGNKRKFKNDETDINGSDYIIPFFYSSTNLTSITTTPGFQQMATNSVFGSADADYKGLAFITVTGRSDWFSTLSIQNNHIFYPSVGGSFVLSQALKLPDWINYAKLRGSWAQVGGGAPNPYQLNLTYSMVQGGFNGQPLQVITKDPTTGTLMVPNSKLEPYTSTTYEVGTELKFLHSRLGLDVAVYSRKTTNDIVSSTVSTASGYNAALLNIGQISNKGIEVLLTATPVASKNFSWNVNYNIAYNKNKIIQLADGLTSIQMAASVNEYAYVYNEVGEAYSSIKGWEIKRDAKGNEVLASNGWQQRGDFVTFGPGVAPLTMGFSNDFTYKRFSLSILVDGKFGNKIFSATNVYATRFGLQKITLPGREDGLTITGVDDNGDPASIAIAPDGISGYYDNWKNLSEKFIYDGSFVKLRQVVFGYNIPVSSIKFVKLQSLNISFVARNVFILYKNVPNVDPESTFTNGNAQGIEMFGVPRTKSYGLNLMVKF